MKDLIRVLKLSDNYGKMLTENQREIIEMYYSLNLSLGEIAEVKGVSRQGVHDTLQKAVKELENIENLVGFVKFKDTLKQLVQKYPDDIKKEITEFVDK